MAFVKRWTGCEPEQLTHGDPTLFCAPTEGDFSEGWHRDARWWGGADENQQDEQANGGDSGGSGGQNADYSDAAQAERWAELSADTADLRSDLSDGDGAVRKRRAEGRQDIGDEVQQGGIAWMMALVDDECHEIVRGSHRRYRTQFEDTVLSAGKRLMATGPDGYSPQVEGFPNSHSAIPGAAIVRLKPGQALIRNGIAIHRGRTSAGVERATLSLGWNKWLPSFSRPTVVDRRMRWLLDPAVREGLGEGWMRTAYDRWRVTQAHTQSPPQLESQGYLLVLRVCGGLQGQGWRSADRPAEL